MEAHEAFERFEHSHEAGAGHGPHRLNAFARRAAILVALLAALLAISELQANEAVKETIVEQGKANDASAKYDATEVKLFQHESELFQLELAMVESSKGRKVEQRQATLQQRTEAELKPALAAAQADAGRHERAHNHADDRHATYEYAVAGFQVAIVLASVAILIGAAWLLGVGALIGLVGLVLLIDGLLA